MGTDTGIEWTDHTFNPWIGCTAVSEACEFCYAKTLVENRMGRDFAERWRTSASNWKQPLRWNKNAERAGIRKRVFCASLADVFDNQVPEEWRADLFDLIRATPMLDWQLLTKRPQNIAKMLPADWVDGYPNVWLGTTCEDQTEADRRISHLLGVPASVRFLSCEPLLGQIDLYSVGVGQYLRANVLVRYSDHCFGNPLTPTASIDWVIAGGESGPGARPSHPDWFRSLRDQCAAAGVPFFFKQWGEWTDYDASRIAKGWEYTHKSVNERFGVLFDQHGIRLFEGRSFATRFPFYGDCIVRVGKKRAGAVLDGREHRAVKAAAEGK